jgi:hypothetical protein
VALDRLDGLDLAGLEGLKGSCARLNVLCVCARSVGGGRSAWLLLSQDGGNWKMFVVGLRG